MITEIMSIFQPSLKNLEKAKEIKLDQNENANGTKQRAELEKILKEGLSSSSFKNKSK